MAGRRIWSLVGASSVLPLALAACHDATGPAGPPPDYADGHVAISNDPAALAARITYFSDSIPVDEIGVGYPTVARPAAAPGTGVQFAAAPVSLQLRAEVTPPVIDGQILQATSVAIAGQLAVVSYAMVGNPYLGGLDVVDISNENRPLLRSQALFRNADINAVSVLGQSVFLSGASGDESLAAPAVVEVMQIQRNALAGAASRRAALASFAGTGVAASGSRAYATSGDRGGLFVLDRASLAPIRFLPIDDARWVEVAGGKVVVVQGTPGRLAVFDEATLAGLGTFPFPGGDVPESKSTAEVVGGKAFIAAGPAGVQVVSVSTGAIVGSVARPDPADLGLPPAVVVTNAVSTEDDLLFISNGEAGVYVARGSSAFTATGSEAPQTIAVLGRLRFARLQSVNHVAYRSRHLVVAAGLGGLKIVRVR